MRKSLSVFWCKAPQRHTRLEYIAYADTEREGDIVVLQAKVVEECKAVVVARLGRGAKGIAAAKPSISNEAPPNPLVPCRSEECSHLSKGARARHRGVVVVARPYKLGAHIEAIEWALGRVVAKKKLMTIAERIAHRVILVLIVARRDEARAELATLSPLGQGAFVGDLVLPVAHDRKVIFTALSLAPSSALAGATIATRSSNTTTNRFIMVLLLRLGVKK